MTILVLPLSAIFNENMEAFADLLKNKGMNGWSIFYNFRALRNQLTSYYEGRDTNEARFSLRDTFNTDITETDFKEAWQNVITDNALRFLGQVQEVIDRFESLRAVYIIGNLTEVQKKHIEENLPKSTRGEITVRTIFSCDRHQFEHQLCNELLGQLKRTGDLIRVFLPSPPPSRAFAWFDWLFSPISYWQSRLNQNTLASLKNNSMKKDSGFIVHTFDVANSGCTTFLQILAKIPKRESPSDTNTIREFTTLEASPPFCPGYQSSGCSDRRDASELPSYSPQTSQLRRYHF